MPESEEITYALASFVAATSYEQLPPEVLERLKTYTLDVLACGFVGARLPWAKIVAEMVSEQSGKAESSVFGQPEQVTASQAALLNGVMIGGFESEHVGHFAHASGTVSPAALAVAERMGASGKDFLLAMALGYEVTCRVGDGQTNATEVERGFHNPAVNGTFAGAAAVGKLLDLDATTQARAFGIAGSYSGGLTEYAWDGSMTKRLHLGLASQGGLEAAILASKGFTGPVSILEGRYGYFHAFSPAPKPEVVLPGLGSEWRLREVTMKAYPCHVSSQGFVDALTRFKLDQALEPKTVSALHVRTTRSLQERFLNPSPDSEMGAQYSMPFNIAVALYRDLRIPLEYDESVLLDEDIRRLAGKVTLEEIATGPDHLSVTAAGTTYELEVEPFRGSPQNPADFSDMEDKFRRYSGHLLDPKQQEAIVAMVRSLEELDDVRELASALRA